jgi:hypothetical protein
LEDLKPTPIDTLLVGGILIAILILAIVTICCYCHKKVTHNQDSKPTEKELELKQETPQKYDKTQNEDIVTARSDKKKGKDEL